MIDDFLTTIDSDDEETITPVNKTSSKGKGKTKVAAEDIDDGTVVLNADFTFELNDDTYAEVLEEQEKLEGLLKGSKHEPISVDDIIARRKLQKKHVTNKRKRPEESDSEPEDSESGSEEEVVEDDEEDDSVSGDESDDPLASSEDEVEVEDTEVEVEGTVEEALDQVQEGGSSEEDDDSDHETQAEKARKKAYFADEVEASDAHTSFTTMNLSRPILKAITALSFHKPTPIQAATIPVALLGKDIVGNAVTGSGKTAAFIIPILERLLYRDRGKKASAVRCVVLVPTRELAVQCYDVGKKLAAFTDIRFCLVVGGLSLKSQEAELRTRPDVLIATPGRLIDHLRNSPSFGLDTIDILILDEADRMLSDGFADELKEIVKSCPASRQVMLFSATMTDSVDELVRMSLNRPVRLFVDPKRTTARGLIQEFVRVRSGKESERSALLVSLCKKTFKAGVIVFLRSKKLAHQLRIVFGILGMKCDELHGDLTQEQRLRALQSFRDGTVQFLMATDLASRGLDIQGIETVINYDMPGQLAQYLHRVGRTARAGKKGRSVTLVGEPDRKMLRAAIKHGSGADQVRHRTIPSEYVAMWSAKLEEITDEVAEVLKEEKEEKAIRKGEMEIKKGQNMLEHEKEIYSRPARTWFQSEKEKQKAENTSKQQYEDGFKGDKKTTGKESKKPERDKFAGLSRKVKRRKLAMEEDEQSGETGAMKAAIRSAKKAARPTKIGALPDRSASGPKKSSATNEKRSRKTAKVTGRKTTFDRDLGEKKRQSKGGAGGERKKSRPAGKGGEKKRSSMGKKVGRRRAK